MIAIRQRGTLRGMRFVVYGTVCDYVRSSSGFTRRRGELDRGAFCRGSPGSILRAQVLGRKRLHGSLLLHLAGGPGDIVRLFAAHKTAVGRRESEDVERQVGVVGIGIEEVLLLRLLESVVMIRALNHVLPEPDRRRTDFLLAGAGGA